MLRCGTKIALAAVLATLALAPSAMANVYNDYAGSGSIDGCAYSPDELRDALGNVPPDIQQYDPGYVSSLNGALANSASGACDPASAGSAAGGGGGAGGTTAHFAKDGSPQPEAAAGAPAASAAPLDLSGDEGFPVALALLAGLFGLLLVGGAVFALVGGSTLSDYWWGLRDRFRR